MESGLQKKIMQSTPIAQIPEELYEQAEKMEEISKELKECAEVISAIDNKMQDIYRKIYSE